MHREEKKFFQLATKQISIILVSLLVSTFLGNLALAEVCSQVECACQTGSGCAVIAQFENCGGNLVDACPETAPEDCESVGGICLAVCDETQIQETAGECENTAEICCVAQEAEGPVQEEILQIKVGEKEEEGAKPEPLDALQQGAKKLNPMKISGPTMLFSRAINIMLAFMGSIALVLYIFAGIMWMTAGGNDERVKKAKSIFVWTTLGALAMGASYMIVRTVLQRVG